MIELCPLCNSESSVFYNENNRIFFSCPCCKLIFLQRSLLLDTCQELERYKLHQNNALDEGYQQFTAPLVTAIETRCTPNDKGLDFGCGRDSALTYILKQKEYNIAQYDPFFANNPKLLERKYHYIACCEVIEHFYTPHREFELFSNILHNGGMLLCMTHIFDSTIDFKNWYYKNDPTHVSIYRKDTCEWISQHFKFANYEISNRLIVFKK